ncbi:hypothetical protein DKX38_030082 (mitochondrion) [Salix brachista]|uniref:ATP synthase protein MI25 n=1 Tax=Salix brachista TaxID=2182728 RepID=A0A5N5J838_9ROSI|nr:hypothetical protein DKX38_030082 [Salix brachista]
MLSLLTLTQLLSSSFGRSFVICLVKTTLATKRLFERVPFIGDRQDILVWENWLKRVQLSNRNRNRWEAQAGAPGESIGSQLLPRSVKLDLGFESTINLSPSTLVEIINVLKLYLIALGERPPSQSGTLGKILPTKSTMGIWGILLNRRNIPIMLMPIELMLLAVNLNFLVFSVSLDDMMGQLFALLVPTVAAAESAIGLAIFVITFRVRGTIAVEFINSIQGKGLSRWASASDSSAKEAFLCICMNRLIFVFLNEIDFHDRKSLGKTFKVTLDGRIQAIQEELLQFLNPNEVVLLESNEQQRLLRISLRICGTVVESLSMARCTPKCEKTVQALLCRNLNLKLATLLNATSSRRIRLQDDLVTKFHVLVSAAFSPSCLLKAKKVELIREGLVVLRKVRVGGSLKNKEDE